MKGLLLKEFYVWLKTRSFFMLYFLGMTIYATTLSSTATSSLLYASLGIIFGLILNSFMVDEKSGWPTYEKALPVSPFQRVTAKFIFVSAELMLPILIMSTALVLNSKFGDPSSLGLTESLVYAVSGISLAIVALAFSLPACISLTGIKRNIIGFIPAVACIFAIVTVSFDIQHNLHGWFEDAFTQKLWFPSAIVLVSIGVLAVSWMITVALESRKDEAYRKKFIIKATAFGTATAIICAATFGALYFGGSLPDPTFSTDISSAEVEKTKKELYPYYDFFCGEIHLEKSYDKCAETLKSIGFENSSLAPNSFSSDSRNITAVLSVDEKTGLVRGVYTTSQINTKIIKGATSADFEKVCSNFTVGMTEKELHQKIKELEIIPSSINERLYSKNQPQRNYYFKFATENYNGSPFDSALCSVSVEVKNGIVCNVRTSFEGAASGSVHDNLENPFTARDEMRALLDSFCNANHLEWTADDSAYALESVGFARNSEYSYSLSSASGKISAKVAIENDSKLTDYIYISGDVGEYNIKKATTEDLNKICENFPEGMSEADLILKFHELEVLPHEILESRNYEKKHLRNYEITYTVDSYNGGEGTDFEINIDVIDGVIYDVRAYS